MRLSANVLHFSVKKLLLLLDFFRQSSGIEFLATCKTVKVHDLYTDFWLFFNGQRLLSDLSGQYNKSCIMFTLLPWSREKWLSFPCFIEFMSSNKALSTCSLNSSVGSGVGSSLCCHGEVVMQETVAQYALRVCFFRQLEGKKYFVYF